LRTGEGQRLLSMIRKISPEKPVVMWKTGKMKATADAISSHTGALAGDMNVFEGAMNQAGAVMAHSMEALFDSTSALMSSRSGCMEAPRRQNASPEDAGGLRVAIVGSGGGFSVDVIDTFCAKGLIRAAFSEHTKDRLTEVLPTINTILVNPVDMGEYGYAPNVFRQALDTIAGDKNVDLVVVTRETDRFVSFARWFELSDIGAEFARAIQDTAQKHRKVILVIATAIRRGEAEQQEHARFLGHLDTIGIASFPTVERAAGAALALQSYMMRQHGGDER
jgi:acyl-CoA synthetase (NDP forming)